MTAPERTTPYCSSLHIECKYDPHNIVVDQGVDYVLALEGNQETLHDDVRRFLDDPETPLMGAPL